MSARATKELPSSSEPILLGHAQSHHNAFASSAENRQRQHCFLRIRGAYPVSSNNLLMVPAAKNVCFCYRQKRQTVGSLVRCVCTKGGALDDSRATYHEWSPTTVFELVLGKMHVGDRMEGRAAWKFVHRHLADGKVERILNAEDPEEKSSPRDMHMSIP